MVGDNWQTKQVVTTIQKSVNATDGARIPGSVHVVGTDKHFVGAQSVGAIAVIDDVEGIDDVALAFAHFFAIRGVDIAIIKKVFDRFAERKVAHVGEEFAPKADIQ